MVDSPFRMSGSDLEALLNVSGQDTLLDVREWSEALRMSGSGQEALPNVR